MQWSLVAHQPKTSVSNHRHQLLHEPGSIPLSLGCSSKIPSMAPFFFLLLFSQILLSAAVDTINSTTPLSGAQKIVSQGGRFALGFYSPTQGNTATSSGSSNYYIAIWYNNIPVQTTVWTANTDVPVSDPTTTSLTIGSDGNLVLLDQSKNQQLWSTNVSVASNSTVAVITNGGSLNLMDASNSSKVYWRSIDHPTNTWLPGGKLGLNKTTGVSQRLVPWKNNANPSPGLFSLELDPNGTTQYFIQWNNSITYWSSGPWNGNIFSLVPEMTAGYNYNFQFIDNATESYFIYSMKDDSIISRFTIEGGQIKQLTWVDSSQQWILFWSQPRTQCEVYALCGAYGSCNLNVLPFCNCIKGFGQKVQTDWDLQDFSGGCKRNTPLQCQINSTPAQTQPDKFYTMAGVRLPDNAQSAVSTSSQDCQVACMNNCSCNAYTYNSSGCFVWHGDLVNLQEQYSGNGGGTLFLRLAASELPDSKKSNKVIIGAVVGGVAAVSIILAIVLFVLFQKCRRERTLRISKTSGGTLIAFRYSDLQHVTNNFSDKLGEGAFGSVFKGKLLDSTAIAVKRLGGLHQGEKQFRAEVSTIGTTQHVNLVRLLGFCSEGSRRLLVYELMPKGSLESQLFPGETTALNWAIRYQIALGIARGLNYLHEKCRDCIIHCDVKPDNILLDDSFVPKVSDFGLAKLLGRDFSRVLTTMRGTRGYLAPEWISGVAITAKADVFSYGMMLFELISGKRNADHKEDDKSFFFPTLASSKLHEGDVQILLDPRLNGDANVDELTRACKVACWCIQADESARPTMGQVVQILEGFLDVNMPPIPRSLGVLGESPDTINFFSDLSSSQTSQKTQNSTTTSQTHSTTSGGSQFQSS